MAGEFKRISDSKILEEGFSSKFRKNLEKFLNVKEFTEIQTDLDFYEKNWLSDEIVNKNISLMADSLLEISLLHEFNSPERASMPHFIGLVIFLIL